MYAEAMYDGAGKTGDLDTLYQNAQELKQLTDNDNNDLRLLGNPLWKFEQKAEVLDLIAQKCGWCNSMLNTLKLLLLNDNFGAFPQTLEQFISEIQGKEFEELFFVDMFTGMREGEILGLSWDCVDFKKQIIKVERQLKRKGNGNTKNHYEFDTLKNGKTRIVKPAPVVFDVLKKVKAKQAKNKLKYGENFKNTENLVFTDELGNHIGAECLLKCFKLKLMLCKRI